MLGSSFFSTSTAPETIKSAAKEIKPWKYVISTYFKYNYMKSGTSVQTLWSQGQVGGSLKYLMVSYN